MSRSAQLQLDMFAGNLESAARVAWEPPPFAPYPNALLRRLGSTLRMVQQAEIMPWPAALAQGEISLFLACVERLPIEMRGDLAERFRNEIARLSFSA